MEHVFDNLVNALEGHKAIYGDLLSISRLKQSELVKGSLETLDNLTRQEEVLIFQAGQLEEERFKHTTALIAHYELEKDAPLSEIIKAAPEDTKKKLEELQKSLRETYSQMIKLNQENMELIKQSLRFLQFSLETLTQETSTTYTAEREMKVETLNRLLDKRV